MEMNLKELIPVHLLAHLKIKSRLLPTEILAISSCAALVKIDLVANPEEKLDFIIGGDFPLNLEGHLSDSFEASPGSSHQGRFALFQFSNLTAHQTETLGSLIDYYARLRRAGVRLGDIPDLKAKSA